MPIIRDPKKIPLLEEEDQEIIRDPKLIPELPQMADSVITDPNQIPQLPEPTALPSPATVTKEEKDILRQRAQKVKDEDATVPLSGQEKKALLRILNESRQTKDPDKLESLLLGAGRGLTAGQLSGVLSHAAAATGKAMGSEKSYRELFNKSYQQFQNLEDKNEQANFWTTIVGDLVGSIVGPAQAIKGIKSATALGAVEGLGRAEERLTMAESTEEAVGAVTEAGITAGLGLGLGLAGKGAAKAIQKAKDTKLPETLNKWWRGTEQAKELATEVAEDLAQKAPAIERNTKALAKARGTKFITNKVDQDFKTFKALELDDSVKAGFAAEAESPLRKEILREAAKRPDRIRKQIKAKVIQGVETFDDWYSLEMKALGIKGKIEDYKAFRGFRNEMNKFVNWAAREGKSTDIDKAIQQSLSRKVDLRTLNSQGKLNDDMYKLFKTEESATNILVNKGFNKIDKALNKQGNDPLKNIYGKIADLRYVGNAISRASGLEISPVIDDVYIASNQFSNFTIKYGKLADNLIKQTEAAKLPLDKVVGYLENPALRKELSESQLQVVTKWREAFDEVLDTARRNGLNIGKLDNYVPHKSLSGNKLKDALVKWANDIDFANIDKVLLKPTSKKGKQALRNFLDTDIGKETRQFVRSLETITGESIESSDQALSLLKNLDKFRRVKQLAVSEVDAAFKRTGEVPRQVRDTDIVRLWFNYVDNMGKGIYYRTPLKALETQSSMLRQMGLGRSAKYLETYIGHMKGISSDFIETGNQVRQYMRNSFKKIVGQEGDLAPEILDRMVQSIYPSFLGFNPRAVLRNYTQPFMMTSGEIGGLYGRKLAMQGYLQTAKLYNLNPKKWLTAAKEQTARLGLAPRRVRFEGKEALTRELRKGLGKRIVKAANVLEDTSMFMYEQSHHQNVLVTSYMSNQLAKDTLDMVTRRLNNLPAFRKDKVIQQFYDLADPGYRSKFKRLLNTGLKTKQQQNELRQEVTKYLVAKTQLAYGKVGMGELGREAGSFFSMFTKWPLTVGGEHVQLIRNATPSRDGLRSAYKLLDKYWFPLAGLAYATTLMDIPETPRQKELLGTKGLTYWSPTTAISPQSIGSLGKPPWAQLLYETYDELYNFDATKAPEYVGKSAEELTRTFTPFGVLLNTYDRLDPLFLNEEKKK